MSTVFNFVSRGVKVLNLDIEWDLYWTMAEDSPEQQKKLHIANWCLTKAAMSALEKQEPAIWYKESDRYADLGAADTEPRWQFAKLWQEAYGEDIY